jgi:nicotinate-nucleotide pyrophosphorylase (carboxylating)
MDWKSHRIDALLEQALLEDQAPRDATTHITIDANLLAAGSIIAREEMVVAGLGAIPRLFEIYARLDQSPEAQTRFEVISHPEIFDGVRVHAGQVLAVIRHNARVLLSCERVILNLLQHMSGIATLTRQFADAIQGTHARILDTRKTRNTLCSVVAAPITASIWPPAFWSRTITSRSAAALRRSLPAHLPGAGLPSERR